MKRIWKRVRYRIEWLALAVALKLVPLLSRNACYQLGGVLGSLAATLDGHGHRVALANLEAAFGDKFSAAERERIARESYQHFARTMLDLFWSPRLTSENFREYIEFANLEEIRAEAVPGRPVIVAGFHYSNWEWLSLGFGWLGLSAAIATEEFKNPLFGEFFAKLREQSGQVTVPRRGAIVKLYKTLRRNGRVALLVDTTLPPHHPTVVIECFGLKTIVTVAHAWLEERTHACLIPLYCELLPGGRYRVVAKRPIEFAHDASHQEIAQACWDAFEPVVRQNPAPWLWMYKHWRYKPAHAARRYPFYSQQSPAFEQIAANLEYTKLDRSRLPGAAQQIA
ncbi:MAG: lysophospholipid acyltransferase family protein [Chthoniobacterales bacterium]